MRGTLGLVGALALAALCACSVIVGTSGLVGEAPAEPGDAATDSSPAVVDAATGPLPSSCRAIHAKLPDAGSGAYDLAGEGGLAVKGDCDMESFGGGWTRVTPAMIVEEKAVQDYAPESPAKVEVIRGTDPRGGVFFDAQVKAVNCADNPFAGPDHYFLVGELDGWTQIMASYTFTASSACWNIFGSLPGKDPQSTNIVPFELGVDLIGPQVNMSRTMSGKAIPFDGKLSFCDETADNFWSGAYDGAPKSARVALRRFSQGKPAGLGIATDCGLPGWKIESIHVR